MDNFKKLTKPISATKPKETPQNAAQQAAKEETTSPRVRRTRAIAFQLIVGIMIAAFAVLTFFVVTIPMFSIDLNITHSLQRINNSFFSGLMVFISWVGFSPQAFITPLIIIVFIYILGFYWEAPTTSLAQCSPR